jgi:ribosomal protein S6--L-glutamate ligase
LSRKKLVIRDNSTLRSQYDSLQAGDIFVGRLCLKPSEEAQLLDLTERGVCLIPSGLSQLASRSKALQAKLFTPFMLPHTRAIHGLHDLIDTISDFQEHSISRVVTKHDRRNAGMGIHLWDSIEDVFTQASFNNIPLPFVIQPFMPDSKDIRVVVLGDYIEAYERHNPNNFRNNLHHGGASEPCQLTDKQLHLCKQVMERGRFPYGHLDILVNSEGESYLGEINLRGGIRGAKIKPREYQAKIDAIHQRLLEEAT